MGRITIEDLKKIKVQVEAETTLRHGGKRVKIIVHMGTCGIASGAKMVMDTVIQEMEQRATHDVIVTSTGCIGLCSKEPIVTIEILNEAPVKYCFVNENKMRQIFVQHVIGGQIQRDFVLGVDELRPVANP